MPNRHSTFWDISDMNIAAFVFVTVILLSLWLFYQFARMIIVEYLDVIFHSSNSKDSHYFDELS
jgi:hypothetical protein